MFQNCTIQGFYKKVNKIYNTHEASNVNAVIIINSMYAGENKLNTMRI